MEPAAGTPPGGSPAAAWVATMSGAELADGISLAHRDGAVARVKPLRVGRGAREEIEGRTLVAGATRARGAGNRALEEEPDELRTCFERDRDRIVHSSAFRRLAGKTQVFVFPRDHERTRLTHALEVAQVATAIARATGLNVALTEAIALGHDCGHGPGGHASEEAFGAFLPGGFHHAPFGADVVLRQLNLCAETLDGIRHHSWSFPAPLTPEGVVVSWADRCAYCAHDLEDAAAAGIVDPAELPDEVVEVVGSTRSSQLRGFIAALVDCISSHGVIAMDSGHADALAALRRFNYERIYTRPASLEQGVAVIAVLRALVEFFIEHPLDPGAPDPASAAVAYVGGMTDRFAFDTAVRLLGFDRARLPRGIDASG